MANPAPITLEQLFRHYKGLPHQMAALQLLEADLRENGYAVAMRRDRPWFEVWSQGGKQNDYAAAIKLIKEFEGCHLSAYPDPLSGGEPWTIGYGTTNYSDGRKVQRGDKLTVIDANKLLDLEVDRIAAKLRTTIPFWNAMSANQQGALISFAYNLGSSFFGAPGFETITKRLRDKDWNAVPEALLLYRNPGTNVEAGLKRRREAEGKLWTGNVELQQRRILLPVPYEAQNDNASGTGYRECFSSSAAMVARFYGKIASDDAYNKYRSKYGDTTDVQAQVKALQGLGLSARFITNFNAAKLEAELNAGRPVMVGWMHKGPITKPTGGGHWSVIVGYTDTAFIHNDPNGEADMAVGGYINHTNGKQVAYSRKNWLRRWEVDGPSTGWALTVSR